jgi:hypothetical protein
LKTKPGSKPIVEFKEIKAKFFEDFLAERNVSKSLKKIWGKWPGDESIDELLNALEERPH